MSTRSALAMRRPLGGSSPRRKTVWNGFGAFSDSLTNGNVQSAAVVNFRVLSQVHGGTVVRIRGEVYARSTTAVVAIGGARVVFGMIMVQGEASDVGVTGLPDPDIDTDASWLWWQELSVMGDASNDLAQLSARSFDGKAQRKITPNTVLALVVKNEANATVAWKVGGRILIKLP